MTFKRVNDFATENPQKLDRELAQLEDNITAEFVLVRKQMAPIARVGTFLPVGVRAIRAILADDQLSVDTTVASAAIVFPVLDANNFGRSFVIIKRVLANNIVTSCQDADVLCNGATFPTLTAIGAYRFFCDATGYYR